MTLRSRLRTVVLAWAGVAAIVGLWALIATGAQSVQVPTPRAVIDAISENFTSTDAVAYAAFRSGGLAGDVAFTVTNTLLGVAVGAIAGLVVGVLVARVEILRRLFQRPLFVLVTVPVLVLLPFLSLWFGVSRLATNGMVIFYAFATVAFGTQQATVNVSNYFQDYAETLGARPPMILREVIGPALVPEVIGFIRGALAFGWGLQAVAETLGGQSGVGKALQVFSYTADTAGMIGAVIVLATVALVIDGIVAVAGGWLTRWQE